MTDVEIAQLATSILNMVNDNGHQCMQFYSATEGFLSNDQPRIENAIMNLALENNNLRTVVIDTPDSYDAFCDTVKTKFVAAGIGKAEMELTDIFYAIPATISDVLVVFKNFDTAIQWQYGFDHLRAWFNRHPQLSYLFLSTNSMQTIETTNGGSTLFQITRSERLN